MFWTQTWKYNAGFKIMEYDVVKHSLYIILRAAPPPQMISHFQNGVLTSRHLSPSTNEPSGSKIYSYEFSIRGELYGFIVTKGL